jgi:hypothetical protein
LKEEHDPCLALRSPAYDEIEGVTVWDLGAYDSGPSEEEIDQNRAEMFSTFGRDDLFNNSKFSRAARQEIEDTSEMSDELCNGYPGRS